MIDLITFSIMANHFHLQLRNRPDRRKKLTRTQIARRWLLLYPKRRDEDGKPVVFLPGDVEADPPGSDTFVHKETREPLTVQWDKMSKSRGNVVNPDEVIAAYGADTMRLYEMFMGPLEHSAPWQPEGVVGCHKFLQRVYRLFFTDAGEDAVETEDALRPLAEGDGSDRQRRPGVQPYARSPWRCHHPPAPRRVCPSDRSADNRPAAYRGWNGCCRSGNPAP